MCTVSQCVQDRRLEIDVHALISTLRKKKKKKKAQAGKESSNLPPKKIIACEEKATTIKTEYNAKKLNGDRDRIVQTTLYERQKPLPFSAARH